MAGWPGREPACGRRPAARRGAARRGRVQEPKGCADRALRVILSGSGCGINYVLM